MGNLLAKKESLDLGPLSPNGLYTHCDWDVRVVKRLILEKKLAPMSVGRENPIEGQLLEECPICFLHYAGGLNRSKCCKKGICTECYLQVRRPSKPSSCPFCNQGQYIVSFTGPLSHDEIAREQQEQRKVRELEVQMRKEEMERDQAREKEKQLKSKSSLYLQTDFSYSQSLPSGQYTTISPPERIASNSSAQRFVSAASSYPPVGRVESPTDTELEELMLMEAIRLSLSNSPRDNSPPISTLSTSVSPPEAIFSSSPPSSSSSSPAVPVLPREPYAQDNTTVEYQGHGIEGIKNTEDPYNIEHIQQTKSVHNMEDRGDNLGIQETDLQRINEGAGRLQNAELVESQNSAESQDTEKVQNALPSNNIESATETNFLHFTENILSAQEI